MSSIHPKLAQVLLGAKSPAPGAKKRHRSMSVAVPGRPRATRALGAPASSPGVRSHTAFQAVEQLLGHVQEVWECASPTPTTPELAGQQVTAPLSIKTHTSKPHDQEAATLSGSLVLIEHQAEGIFWLLLNIDLRVHSKCMIVRFYGISYLRKVCQCCSTF